MGGHKCVDAVKLELAGGGVHIYRSLCADAVRSDLRRSILYYWDWEDEHEERM